MESHASDILWTGFFGLDAGEVEGPPSGGVVLFGRNLDPDPVKGPARCHGMIRQLQAKWGERVPLAVAIDQEGGPVSRLKVWTGPTPSLRDIWTQGGIARCEAWGRLWGQGCRLLGINVDFAPVTDLWDGHVGTGLESRCASTEPREVAQAAGAFLYGLESTGVRGCLKHFPGLGGTTVDSHAALPVLSDPDQLQRNRHPFYALAHEDRLVMVAHVKTPTSEGLPASLHRGHVADNPWGVQGRWLPDDLEMGGCSEWDWPTRVRLCLEAGHQALLVCQTPEGIDACASALRTLPRALWTPARERFLAFRQHLVANEGAHFDPSAWQVWLAAVKAAC